jgi:hypothetical protein
MHKEFNNRFSPLFAMSLLAAGFAVGVFFSPLLAQAVGAAKSYNTRGTVVSREGTKLVLKDKQGMLWEYETNADFKGKVGQEGKVNYTMKAHSLEAP